MLWCNGACGVLTHQWVKSRGHFGGMAANGWCETLVAPSKQSRNIAPTVPRFRIEVSGRWVTIVSTVGSPLPLPLQAKGRLLIINLQTPYLLLVAGDKDISTFTCGSEASRPGHADSPTAQLYYK